MLVVATVKYVGLGLVLLGYATVFRDGSAAGVVFVKIGKSRLPS
jgi:hypothetical protein